MARSLGLVVAAAMLAAACADAGPPATEVTTSLVPAPVSSTVTAASSTTSTVSPSSPDTSQAPTTTTPTATVTTGVSVDPPTPVSTPGPLPGSEWWVVGVALDDVLNIRAGPGATEVIVSTMGPDGGPVAVTGEARLVGSGVWWEIGLDDGSAWVNARYLGALADTSDITSWLVERGGDIPVADSMGELVDQVIALRGGGDAMVIHVGLSADSPIGEVAVDLFTGPDDAIRGERLRVFGQRMDDGGPFGLHSVEATSICWRGVDQAGLCV